ncbi:MAG: CinA domain protein [Flavipsychrobacter sp.]|jgi:PncC family amidohydrolase|nr:CinA domain protein [Flavipsychrobacter sp.]
MIHSLFDIRQIDKVKEFLVQKNETIAVAESVTGGLMQVALALAKDAGKYFQGGLTAYNIGQKARHLLVEPIHAVACNCVSQKVADEMALNVCRSFNSDWGIGITGYSTAVPESGNKLFCYYAIVHHHKVVVKGKLTQAEDEPFKVQVHYVVDIIESVLQVMK